MAKQPMGDVVVLLPGILGSVLQRDGKDVWAPSPGAIGRALWTLGRSVKSLALGSDPWEADDLGDGVVATRLMPGVHIVPGLWGIDVYSGISRMITEHFDVVPGRRSSSSRTTGAVTTGSQRGGCNAWPTRSCTLQRQVNPDAKLILIGHSMGGLVSRYFLECLDGWRDTRMLITFGTPYRGSVNAVDFLVNGFVKKVGPLKVADLTTLLRSLTSVYQLLPVYPCVDLGAGYERSASWVIGCPASIRRAGRQRAGRLPPGHRGRRRRPRAAATTRSTRSSGSARARSSPAGWSGERLMIEESHGGEDMGGDGTVPRVSATPIETDDWCSRRTSRCTPRSATGRCRPPRPCRPSCSASSRPGRATGFRAVQGVRAGGRRAAGHRRAAGRAGAARSGQPDDAGRRHGPRHRPGRRARRCTMRRDSRRGAPRRDRRRCPPATTACASTPCGDSAGLADPVHGLVCVIDDAAPDVDPAIDG